MTLYKTFMRPHLEYCTPVWNPFLASNIDQMENHATTDLLWAWWAYLMKKGYNIFTYTLDAAAGSVLI